MKLKGLVIVLVTVGVLALAVTGFFAYRFFFAPKGDDAISLVPEDSFLYGSVFIEPSTQQKMAIEDLLAKTPLEDFDTAAERLKGVFDDGLQETGCSFEDDFEPWLGDQIAGFALPPEGTSPETEGAVLISVTDEDAARKAFVECNEEEVSVEEETSYKDIEYEVMSNGNAIAAIDGFLVVATEAGLEAAIDAREGASLEESDRYQDATEDLAEDTLASFYVDLRPVVEAAEEDPEMSSQDVAALESLAGGSVERPITATLLARSDAVVLEYAAGIPEEGPLGGLATSFSSSDVLATMPADSWAAFGFGNFGGYLQGILDSLDAAGVPGVDQEALEEQVRNQTGLDLQNDILSWMGDIGFFVRGTSLFNLDGGVILGAKDENAAVGATAVLGQFLSQQGAPVSRAEIEGANGFTVQIPGVPQAVNVVVGNERAVIGYGDRATVEGLAPSDVLGDTEGFKTASEVLGSDMSMALYVEMSAVVDLVGSSGAESDATYREDVKPILDSVKYVASGSKVEDDTSITRLVVGAE